MADFTDRIKLIYDVSADQAKSGLGQIKSGVGEAEGAFGKLKAGASGVFGQLAAAGPAAFAAVGAAAGAFFVNAIGQFTDLAFAAETFSTAAGVSIEDASRWLEVADDLGVQADAVQGAMSRLNREAAQGKLAEFGITAGNANDRLIQTLQYLASIPNEADRSRAAFELLGKGSAAIAPLLANVGELKDRLADVKGGKIIDEGDLDRAKQLRDNMDNLADAWDSIVISVGGSIAPLVSALAALIDKAAQLAQAGNDPGSSWWESLVGSAIVNTPAIGFLADAVGLVGDNAEDTADKVPPATKSISELGEANAEATKQIQALNDAMLAQFNSQLALADAADKSTDAIAKVVEKTVAAEASSYGSATANDELRRATNDAEQAILAQAAAAAKMDADQQAAAGGSQTLAEKNAIMIGVLNTLAGTLDPASPLARHLADYSKQLASVPTEVDTEVSVDTAAAEEELQAFLVQKRVLLIQAAMAESGGSVYRPTGTSSSTAAVGVGARALAVPALMPAPTTNIHVAVSVPPGVPSAEIGRYVADALVAHERRVGSQRR